MRAWRRVSKTKGGFICAIGVDRIANVRISADYTPSGYTITRPDEMIGIYKHKGLALVTDGEILPIAQGPLGGKGAFYQCRYGDYLMAMNCTDEKTFEIDIPNDLKDTSAEELISGRKYKLTQVVVQPLGTLILYTGRR